MDDPYPSLVRPEPTAIGGFRVAMAAMGVSHDSHDSRCPAG